MAHHPPPPPHHHGPHEWLINDERVRPLAEIASRLQQMGQLLQERGSIKLGGNEITPTDPALFITRYERMPKGELSLKLELMWGEEMRRTQQDPELSIE